MDGQYRGPRPSISPEKTGACSILPRITACVASVVFVMWQAICWFTGCSDSTENSSGTTSPALGLQSAIINGAPIEPRGRARLQAAERQFELRESSPRAPGWRLADATRRDLHRTDMNEASQGRSPWSRPPPRRRSRRPSAVEHSSNLAIDDLEIDGFACAHVQSVDFAEQSLDGASVEGPVALRPRTSDRRTLAPVQHPELNSGKIGSAPHDTVKGIHLPDQDAPCRSRRSRDCRTFRPATSGLRVNSRVRAPMRAEAAAASVPACPPPITITSKKLMTLP